MEIMVRLKQQGQKVGRGVSPTEGKGGFSHPQGERGNYFTLGQNQPPCKSLQLPIDRITVHK